MEGEANAKTMSLQMGANPIPDEFSSLSLKVDRHSILPITNWRRFRIAFAFKGCSQGAIVTAFYLMHEMGYI